MYLIVLIPVSLSPRVYYQKAPTRMRDIVKKDGGHNFGYWEEKEQVKKIIEVIISLGELYENTQMSTEVVVFNFWKIYIDRTKNQFFFLLIMWDGCIGTQITVRMCVCCVIVMV